jgi:hypothetical protein
MYINKPLSRQGSRGFVAAWQANSDFRVLGPCFLPPGARVEAPFSKEAIPTFSGKSSFGL